MIQRIQTVYLALGLILLGMIGWMDLGEIAAGGNVYNYTIQGITQTGGENTISGLPVMALWIITVLLQIAAIFGYKKRVRQMRISTLNLLLMLGSVVAFWFFAKWSFNNADDVTISYNIAMVFPIVSAILNYLAIRGIGKDEALVRSLDRLR